MAVGEAVNLGTGVDVGWNVMPLAGVDVGRTRMPALALSPDSPVAAALTATGVEVAAGGPAGPPACANAEVTVGFAGGEAVVAVVVGKNSSMPIPSRATTTPSKA
ncbi:MAG: hypothetical protein Q9O62_09065, partial [Ardenticatenia bacterium]|nr:hypothetical protein [Ardenticatenia bacterium]